MHVLVAGWFSFKDMGNSAGDMIARDMICDWLKEANIPFDVAVSYSSLYAGGLDINYVDPLKYTDVVFVCGPFGNGWPITEMLEKFRHARLTGVNLTMLEALDVWNPFSILFERDSSAKSNPDITFSSDTPNVPVVGVIQITKQDEYGKRDVHGRSNKLIEDFINEHNIAYVTIDTVIKNNKGGLKSAAEIESVIRKMDVVITTRLHGTVLALKNGVPVIPIDPVEGGAKISKQVKTIGWPILFAGENVSLNQIETAFNFCVSAEGRRKAIECAVNAKKKIEQIHQEFISQLLRGK